MANSITVNLFLSLWTTPPNRGRLTCKAELIREDFEEGLTVQSEHDGEVGAQRAPDEHMVDDGPEARVQGDL